MRRLVLSLLLIALPATAHILPKDIALNATVTSGTEADMVVWQGQSYPLYGIIAPQGNEYYAKTALEGLRLILLGQEVTVITGSLHGVRVILPNGNDLSEVMVCNSQARWNGITPDAKLQACDATARILKRGIWALPLQRY